MRGRWKWVAVAGVAVFGAGMAAGIAIGIERDLTQAAVVLGPMIGLFTLVATGLAWRAATHPRLDARTRSAWKWIGASFTVLTAAMVLYNLTPTDDFPAAAIACRLLATLLLLIGLSRLPMRPLAPGHGVRLLLDAGTVAAASGLFLWHLVINPMIASQQSTVEFVASAALHPLLDVGLIFVMSLVLMRGVNSSVRHAARLLMLAALCWVVGETLLTRNDLDAANFGSIGWEFLCIPVAHFLLCAATFEQVRRAHDSHDVDTRTRHVAPVSNLPYAAIVAVFGVLIFVAAQDGFRLPWLGLILCTAVLTGCVVARQALAQRENLRMAVTDGLTGLTNRTGLNEALHLTLERGAKSGRTTAVLLGDLDGFKAVNDTLGHEAGDRLLVEFATALRRSVLGRDVVARLGGDEFAVVLAEVDHRGNAEAVVRRLHRELESPVLIGDTLVRIDSSIGVALSGPGEMTVDQILHHADMEMYEVKRARKAERAAEPALAE